MSNRFDIDKIEQFWKSSQPKKKHQLTCISLILSNLPKIPTLFLTLYNIHQNPPKFQQSTSSQSPISKKGSFSRPSRLSCPKKRIFGKLWGQLFEKTNITRCSLPWKLAGEDVNIRHAHEAHGNNRGKLCNQQQANHLYITFFQSLFQWKCDRSVK